MLPLPIAKKQSAFLFSSASESIIPYGGLSRNGKPSAVCRFIDCPCSKPCFYPPINERRCYMQFLTHIIFLLNLLKTLINHFT